MDVPTAISILAIIVGFDSIAIAFKKPGIAAVMVVASLIFMYVSIET